jgi:pyruvate dehydrogenase phosphatase
LIIIVTLVSQPSYLFCYSTTNNAERAHTEAILPVPTGLWSFFGTFDCRFTGQHEAGPNWFRRQNLIMAATGALADLYHDTWDAAGSVPSEYPIPSSADIRRTLQETFWRLDADTALHSQAAITAAATMTSGDPPPTSNQAQLPDTSRTILAFYDGPTHRLHLASTGKTCAVIRHNTGRDMKLLAHGAHLPQVSVTSQSAQWYDEGRKHHPLNDSVKADANGNNRSADHGFQDQTRGKIAPLQSSFQTVYPMVTSVDICPGDVVILASGNIWEHHNHAAIADALGPSLREQHVKRANPAQQGDHPRSQLNYNTEVLGEAQVGLTNRSVVSFNSTSNPRDGGNAAKRLIEKISEMGTLEK